MLDLCEKTWRGGTKVSVKITCGHVEEKGACVAIVLIENITALN